LNTERNCWGSVKKKKEEKEVIGGKGKGMSLGVHDHLNRKEGKVLRGAMDRDHIKCLGREKSALTEERGRHPTGRVAYPSFDGGRGREQNPLKKKKRVCEKKRKKKKGCFK